MVETVRRPRDGVPAGGGAEAVRWDAVEPRTVIPGFHGRFVHSANLTFALWSIDAGAAAPEHAHLHEQTVYVLSGELELTVAGATRRLPEGSMLVIPPHVPHAARAIAACRVLDVFSPIREDYLDPSAPSILQDASRP